MVTRRNFTIAGAAAAATALIPAVVAKAAETLAPETTTSRPYTIIVPFAKGGTTDQMARMIAAPLAEALGSDVHIHNITGDWGATGAVIAANATADGHTLVMGQTGTHVVGAHRATSHGMKKRYDAVADFAPVGLVGIAPISFVVSNDMPVKDLADLEAYVKVYPRSMAIAHGGFGTPSHIGGQKLKTAFGTHLLGEKVYASTLAALDDLAAGKAQIMAVSLAQALPYIKAGKVKALGIAASSRNAALPEIYTGTQQGYAELRASHWNGLFAPAGLKPEVQARLAAALTKALDNPATQRKMRDLGIHVPFVEQQGPKALAQLQAREIAEITATA